MLLASRAPRNRTHTMTQRHATLVRTGKFARIETMQLNELYQLAHALCPQGFPHDETRVLEAMNAHIPLALVDELRADLAAQLALAPALFSRDHFTAQGCGPLSLHDDTRNYPAVYFAIVVVHSGQLGIVDKASRAQRHAPGEILLLDPRKKHAVVPLGKRGRDQRMAPEATWAHDAANQFMFLDFEIERAQARHLFRT
jgi:hypothetical protein